PGLVIPRPPISALVPYTTLFRSEGKAVAVSAWTGEGVEALREAIAALIDDDPETHLTIEPHRGDLLAWLYDNGRVTSREADEAGDRKSTRLNSSHVKISYAVFCL